MWAQCMERARFGIVKIPVTGGLRGGFFPPQIAEQSGPGAGLLSLKWIAQAVGRPPGEVGVSCPSGPVFGGSVFLVGSGRLPFGVPLLWLAFSSFTSSV